MNGHDLAHSALPSLPFWCVLLSCMFVCLYVRTLALLYLAMSNSCFSVFGFAEFVAYVLLLLVLVLPL